MHHFLKVIVPITANNSVAVNSKSKHFRIILCSVYYSLQTPEKGRRHLEIPRNLPIHIGNNHEHEQHPGPHSNPLSHPLDHQHLVGPPLAAQFPGSGQLRLLIRTERSRPGLLRHPVRKRPRNNRRDSLRQPPQDADGHHRTEQAVQLVRDSTWSRTQEHLVVVAHS